MKLGRKKRDITEGDHAAVQAYDQAANTAANTAVNAAADTEEQTDLTKLKKKELLEIMLKQGEEIDALRAEVADLKAQLESREFTLSKVGSIAEASLAVTDIFKEADKAAMTYLANLRRITEEGMKK